MPPGSGLIVPESPRAQVRALRSKRRATQARLARVREALARWDALDAGTPGVERPTVGRQALQALERVLTEALEELDGAWDRRH